MRADFGKYIKTASQKREAVSLVDDYLSRKRNTAEASAKRPVSMPQSDPPSDTPKALKPANRKNKIMHHTEILDGIFI
jgi:hypothetical protein